MKSVFSFLILSLLICKLCKGASFESPNAPWGIDAELSQKRVAEKPVKQSSGQKTCKAMIRFFQVYISPIDGPRSSYAPTSSQYTLEAIQKHGVFKGIAMGCDRLMRENGEVWMYDTIRTDEGLERKVDPVR